MNAPELASAWFIRNETLPGGTVHRGRGGEAGLDGRRLLPACFVFSLALHAFLLYGLEVRRPVSRSPETLLLVDITLPASAPVHSADSGLAARDASAPPSAAIAPPRPKPKRPVVSAPPAAVAKDRQNRAGSDAKAVVPRDETAKVAEPSPEVSPPVGGLAKRHGVTVLANESSQDTLKHGAEARFMHGVATEEFVEENYVGEYVLADLGRVWIEDDRARSGHLILHAEGMGLHRWLYRFNRFIYVYGDSSESPSPVLGSVTFFSDGYHIHQFLWQHNATQAFFPRRK